MAHQQQNCSRQLHIQDLEIEVIHKNIKNIYLRVYPQTQKVCLSCPRRTNKATIHQFILHKMDWIKHQLTTSSPQIQLNNNAVGATCYFRGQPYLLQLQERSAKPQIVLHQDQLILSLPSPSTPPRINSILDAWYRQQLKAEVPELLAKWESVVGVNVNEWRIKKMKTRWGTCNIPDRRIWLNLALIKLPPHCLEYVMVHELVHLLERKHNHRFQAYLTEFMPCWQKYEQELQKFSLR